MAILMRLLIAVCILNSGTILQADEPSSPSKQKEDPATKDAPATKGSKEEKPKPDPRLVRQTPEGTLRIFLIGVAVSNADLIKTTTVPLMEDELKLVLGDPKAKRPSLAEAKAQFIDAEIKVLKPGDKFTLPTGKEIVLPAESRPGEEMVLQIVGSPLPFRLHFHQKVWWVDAAPLVRARRVLADGKK